MGSTVPVFLRMDKAKDHIVRDAKDNKRLGCVLATVAVGMAMVGGGFLISYSGSSLRSGLKDEKVSSISCFKEKCKAPKFLDLTEAFQAKSDRAIVSARLTNTSVPKLKLS